MSDSLFFIGSLIIFSYMNIWFLVSLLVKRNDIVDIAWGLGFIVISWSAWILSDESTLRGLILAILITIWGLRLATHIFNRNKNKSEDARYLKWRQEWGSWLYIRSYFQIYILQGFFMFLISVPVLIVNSGQQGDLGFLALIGILIWIIGFLFESIGDYQLNKFISNPENKGKLMQEGLWSYSRHPNYFGEVTLWWGIWLISISSTFSLIGVISPVTITILILGISGIPMLERNMANKPDFEEYKSRVSAFFPYRKS